MLDQECRTLGCSWLAVRYEISTNLNFLWLTGKGSLTTEEEDALADIAYALNVNSGKFTWNEKSVDFLYLPSRKLIVFFFYIRSVHFIRAETHILLILHGTKTVANGNEKVAANEPRQGITARLPLNLRRTSWVSKRAS